MTSLASLLCSHCEGAGLELQSGGRVICRYCGIANVLDGVVCPHCEHVSAPGAGVCGNCRQSLQRPCPQCGTRNWAGAETCSRCAASLDSVARLSGRYAVDPAARFNAQQHGSRGIKLEEEQGSQRRLAEMHAIEARRQANLREMQTKKAAEQRGLMIGTAAVVFVIVAAVVVSLILSGLR